MFISGSPSVFSVLSVQSPHLQPSRAAEEAFVIWWGMIAQTFNNDDKKMCKNKQWSYLIIPEKVMGLF